MIDHHEPEPVTDDPDSMGFLTRFLVGFAVITGMFLCGGAVGGLLRVAGVPYGGWVGSGVGALAFFAAFVLAFRRYDASVASG